MSNAFDPYHRWLGIPPNQQPANYYRLLGVELFEPDSSVIDAAASRQMAHVRTYALGEHARPSQRVLSELVAARLCLLNRQKKAAYDVALRNSLPASPPMLDALAISPSSDLVALEMLVAESSRQLSQMPADSASVPESDSRARI